MAQGTPASQQAPPPAGPAGPPDAHCAGIHGGMQRSPSEPYARLLEDLGVEDGLALHRLLSAPEVGDALAGGLVVQVLDLGPSVVLGVRVDLEQGLDLLSAEEPAAGDLERLLAVEHVHDTEGVLAELVRALHEAAHQVAGHEAHRVLRVVVVGAPPEGVALAVQHLPELLHGRVQVGGVGVGALPLIQRHGALGQQVERVLGLLGRDGGGDGLLGLLGARASASRVGIGGSLLLLGRLLLLGCLLLLGGLLLLGRLDLLLAQRHLAQHGAERSLVDAGAEPADHAGEGGAELGVQEELEGVHQGGGDDDVGQRDLVAHQEGAAEQVVLQHGQRRLDVHLGLADGLGVVGRHADHGQEPGTHGHLQLVGAPVHPRVHLARLEERLAVQLGVRAQAGDVAGDGVRLKDVALSGLQHRHLAHRVLGQELLRLVGHATLPFRQWLSS
mmetsp:Transcript_7253/g.22887  ORF Transcript_7253/g.22887 Transcript_7253/m.22887 type:complete len:444 (+) Transcript_7253:28-1359(+)